MFRADKLKDWMMESSSATPHGVLCRTAEQCNNVADALGVLLRPGPFGSAGAMLSNSSSGKVVVEWQYEPSGGSGGR